MSIKNKNSVPAKVAAKKASIKKVDIGEATYKIVTEHMDNIMVLSNQLEAEKLSLNKIVTTCLEAGGVEIKEGMKTSFNKEEKQFVVE